MELITKKSLIPSIDGCGARALSVILLAKFSFMEKDIENIKFGQRIALLRHERGISQEILAFKCGINRTYIGEIERGEKSPSVVIIAKIAKGLGTTKKHLMDYE